MVVMILKKRLNWAHSEEFFEDPFDIAHILAKEETKKMELSESHNNVSLDENTFEEYTPNRTFMVQSASNTDTDSPVEKLFCSSKRNRKSEKEFWEDVGVGVIDDIFQREKRQCTRKKETVVLVAFDKKMKPKESVQQSVVFTGKDKTKEVGDSKRDLRKTTWNSQLDTKLIKSLSDSKFYTKRHGNRRYKWKLISSEIFNGEISKEGIRKRWKQLKVKEPTRVIFEDTQESDEISKREKKEQSKEVGVTKEVHIPLVSPLKDSNCNKENQQMAEVGWGTGGGTPTRREIPKSKFPMGSGASGFGWEPFDFEKEDSMDKASECIDGHKTHKRTLRTVNLLPGLEKTSPLSPTLEFNDLFEKQIMF